ncbi:phosphoenolpyruvate synthase [Thiohalophilus thiocyanatoxydans]|uniref:Phosphoenolpyruvate synthase n=1 Tax=Thiohalophilus thiocyanatoxydans TaxID=381308 RepID=A0A4R8IQN8_9GAMM|nr:phosphoenolpyruvate synthase [Thiohalophilus thiocyanatoxydans]TDY01570.1 phosphoenolpyruvate synthase [Thiohalophilus thiocyanatoxydans]
MAQHLIWFDELRLDDVPRVGGKNASLGEMIHQLSDAGVRVPGGFATTADAFREFLEYEGLADRIYAELDQLDTNDVVALAKSGERIRQWIIDTPFPPELEKQLHEAISKLQQDHGEEVSFAVRSSATAEDLPEASFAGQQESYLNIKGEANLMDAIRHVFASLFNDRAITYRVHNKFDHRQVALSAGVQRMIRSDIGASGVLFTIDTESGFEDAVFITAAYGLGETVVQGQVNPDEFYVFKPMLEKNKQAVIRRNLGQKAIRMVYGEDSGYTGSTRTEEVPLEQQRQFCINDEEAMELARQAVTIEKHYGRPMDIEWARDGLDGQLYIVQARPETVKSRSDRNVLERYEMEDYGKVLATGRSIGQRIGSGVARTIMNVKEMDRLQQGDVLITDMTDPDWEPVMKRASAIVTNRGGRTCHAAIIARELGIPAVVGCGDATEAITDGKETTVSCAEGDTGYIYEGIQPFEIKRVSLDSMPELPFKIMLNVGSPDRAFDFSYLPCAGVGLARLEFIINRMIGVHPKALLNYNKQPDEIKQQIDRQTAGYPDPVSFFIEKLAEGIGTIAAAFWPKPVIVRMSDFKSNEYRNLIGGEAYEPHEENPMIGFRGAGRYIAKSFRDCFELECFALKKVRDEMGLTNVAIMIPFVRTVEEAHEIINLLHDNELQRGVNDLKIIMMCEIPSNALLADKFLQYFDGYSIGSNDLTQLTLGLDRDSELVAELFDERNEAVKMLLSMAIKACRLQNKYIGICGQAPSDHPDLAFWLMEQGINSVSLNPDSVIPTWLYLAEHLQEKNT